MNFTASYCRKCHSLEQVDLVEDVGCGCENYFHATYIDIFLLPYVATNVKER